MKSFLTILLVVIMGGGIVWAAIWGAIRLARKSEEDSATLIVKLLATLTILGVLILVVAPLVARGGYEGAFGGVPLAAACALCLTILWGGNVGALFARSLTNIFDGGDVALEPKPFYAIARSQLKLGREEVALAALNKQLEKFPEDFEGLMLLAEIQAVHRHDMEAAENTVQRIANQPQRPPGAIAGAFSTLADWHLQISHDPESARRAFEEIVARLPNSEWSSQAAQRIAHLTGVLDAAAMRTMEPMAMRKGEDYLGVLKPGGPLAVDETGLLAEEEKLVAHLGEHPLDTEARERLALLYARELGQPDLGIQQLDFLIGLPHQPAKNTGRWLNLMADLQIQFGHDPEAPRQTLQRIADSFAGTALAETAQRRLATLAYEFKGKQKSQAVKLGSYEQNIGLKRDRPPTAT